MLGSYKKGVVFYNVYNSKYEKYKNLTRACCRRFRTIGFNNKINEHTIITFGDIELISFTPKMNFNKTNVERFLLSMFETIS
jgi:hypothetical protein